jgi:hypothetical protein
VTSTAVTSTAVTSTAAPTGTALAQLGPFVEQAGGIDAALRALSARVNAGIDARAIRIAPADVAALTAITPHRLVAAVPGGLPDALLRPVLLVFADLVSRRDAFNRWQEYASQTPVPRDSDHGRDLMRCLGNGASAAGHFAADLAALQAVARATPTVTTAAADARAGAELAVRAALVEGVNGGCAECGGFVARPTVLWPITWKQVVLAPGSVWDGTIGTLQFRARYDRTTGWTVNLNAC